MSKASTGVSQVKSLSHNVHGHAEALQPTAICFGKMDKVELRRFAGFLFCLNVRQRPSVVGGSALSTDFRARTGKGPCQAGSQNLFTHYLKPLSLTEGQ